MMGSRDIGIGEERCRILGRLLREARGPTKAVMPMMMIDIGLKNKFSTNFK